MRVVALLLAALGGVAWFARDATFLSGMRGAIMPLTPHAAYSISLRQTGLDVTPVGRRWLSAATQAVEDPTPVRLPFQRSVVHTHEHPSALGYRVALKRGQRIEVVARFAGDTPSQTFVDVFEPETGTSPTEVGSLWGTAFEARRDGDVIVRVQPELLRAGKLHVMARAAPALRFPVANARPRDLQSVFGDTRDGGERQHEGVDIFAKRGTDVLSASAGLVTRVNETGIGGRVVWVWDTSRSLMLYYAHLDQQLVTAGQYVRPGDVIGTVGNTGNARTTPPHLHFGIYDSGRGAINPEAFIAGI